MSAKIHTLVFMDFKVERDELKKIDVKDWRWHKRLNPFPAPRERSNSKSASGDHPEARPFQQLSKSLVLEIGRNIQNEAKKALNTLAAGASEKRPRSGLFSAS